MRGEKGEGQGEKGEGTQPPGWEELWREAKKEALSPSPVRMRSKTISPPPPSRHHRAPPRYAKGRASAQLQAQKPARVARTNDVINRRPIEHVDGGGSKAPAQLNSLPPGKVAKRLFLKQVLQEETSFARPVLAPPKLKLKLLDNLC